MVSQTGVAWLLQRHRDWSDKVAPEIAAMAQAGDRLTARDYLNALDIISDLPALIS